MVITSAAKGNLKIFEESGEYLFHGSNNKLEELEPRQQMRFDRASGKSVSDGKPAICATPFSEIAIFRSIISSHIAKEYGLKNYYSEFFLDDGNPIFKATQEIVDCIQNNKVIGYVHIFKKSDFQRHNTMEWRAYKSVRPIDIVEVNYQDLPRDIEIVGLPK